MECQCEHQVPTAYTDICKIQIEAKKYKALKLPFLKEKKNYKAHNGCRLDSIKEFFSFACPGVKQCVAWSLATQYTMSEKLMQKVEYGIS